MPKTRKKAMTQRLLRAIEEALSFRLAGEHEDYMAPMKDYEDAWDVVIQRLRD